MLGAAPVDSEDRFRNRATAPVAAGHSIGLDVPDHLIPVFPAYEERFLCFVLRPALPSHLRHVPPVHPRVLDYACRRRCESCAASARRRGRRPSSLMPERALGHAIVDLRRSDDEVPTALALEDPDSSIEEYLAALSSEVCSCE